jgi:dipeptidase E
MGKIVAIGGGNIGRPGTLVETLEIDLEIIRLSGKPHPKLLFVPTATSDAESYCEAVRQHFGGRLNCQVDILYLINNPQTTKEIEEKVLASDIVYVGGGNTLKMLIEWRKRGLDRVLLMIKQELPAVSAAGMNCRRPSG